MSDTLTPPPLFTETGIEERGITVKILGIGGAGNNAVDRLKLDNLDQVHLAVINTDAKTLSSSLVQDRLMIGREITRGLSTGGEVEIGRQAAEADAEAIRRLVRGTDLLFILAGLGRGTGSGASPVVARIAAEEGAIVVAFVTTPFSREGQRLHQQAEQSLSALRESCHAVIPLPNDILLQEVDENATLMEAMAVADEWIKRGVQSVWSMLFQTGLINVDFGTLKKAFAIRGGKTLFGLGYAQGEDYVNKALEDLSRCPLLHLPDNKYMRKADSLIVNITGGPDLSLAKVNQVMEHVTETFGGKDHTVLGAVIDGGMAQSLRITVIGTTDLNAGKRMKPAMARPVENAAAIPMNEPRPVTRSVPTKGRASKGNQGEFAFNQEEDTRGFFERTDANLFEGEDLDVPTYLRRGIKIALAP